MCARRQAGRQHTIGTTKAKMHHARKIKMPITRTPLRKRKAKARGEVENASKWNRKINPELIEEFCHHIRRMIPSTTVCDLMGISTKTYGKWKQRGRAYEEAMEEGETPKAGEKIYFLFYDGERRAQAKWKMRVIGRSLNPAENVPSWVRDMTILERRDRNNWGRKDFLEVAENDTFDPDESFL